MGNGDLGAALPWLDAVDDAGRARLDRLANLAARLGRVEMAVIVACRGDDLEILGSSGACDCDLMPLSERVQRRGEALFLPDAKAAEEAGAALPSGIEGYLGLPVRDDDGSIAGILSVGSRQSFELSPSRREALTAVAELALEQLRVAASLDIYHRLQVSEQRYRALSESNPDSIYTIDTAGRFTSANGALARLSGYTLDELIGTDFFPLVAPEQQDEAMDHFRRCLAGEPRAFRLRAIRRDGDSIYVSVTIAPHVVDGELLGLVGISRDITDYVTAEQRLDLALESSGQGIWEWDLGAERVFRSAHLRRVLGESDGSEWECAGDWLRRMHADDREAFSQQMARVRAGEIEGFAGEWRLECNGLYRWFQWHARVFRRDANNGVTQVIGAVADIHDRRLAEDRRLREAGRVALALRAGGAGSFELDLDSGLFDYDETLRDVFGLDEGQGVGLDLMAARVHPDDRVRFRDDMGQLWHQARQLDREWRIIDAEGTVRHLRVLAQRIHSAHGNPVVVGTLWDITDAREMAHELDHQARHDALTGLANRHEFESQLAAIRDCGQRDDRQHAVGFIDLDRFKILNDTAGHHAGDALLRELANRLKRRLRGSDVLARLGGDEFGVVTLDCGADDACARLEDLLVELADEPFCWQGRTFDISASAGVAALASDVGIAEVMSRADVACHTAKQRGRGRVVMYQGETGDTLQHHQELHLAADIREALRSGRFELHGQLIQACDPAATNRPPVVELLVRMIDANGLVVRPDIFIPAAERYDLMSSVDRWVLREALLGNWPDLARQRGLRLSVNLSAQSLGEPSLVEFVSALIAKSSLPAAQLNLEITETAIMAQLDHACEVVHKLRALGCTIALDDFGNGLSSFRYLRYFPVDIIKIDGGFVRAMVDSEPDRIIVESINDLAHRLGAITVAEYVSDAAVLEQVRALGVDYAQGFALARPLTWQELAA
jgi:diguanylate cyclase (GGDEF)-like protein/PAS domain S-box-containing protein